MDHDGLSGLTHVLILLALSVGAVAGLRRLHLPPILGYLLVGILVGPHALGWLPNSMAIHRLAEIGVVFLLFTIGMEFSLAHLIAMRGAVLGLGASQVVLSTLSGAFVVSWLDMPWDGALVVGGALALSSTAIVTKQLTEQLELDSRHGQLALAVLIFQDLAVVPFLVAIPILAGEQTELALPLLEALFKGAVAFAVILGMGQFLLRPLLHAVAAARSEELFTLAALFMALAAAWLTNLLGLSLALGAFLAGMMLSETEYKPQIEGDIRPFRDVLMGLFFIYVGLQLDLSQLPDIWPSVLLVLAGLVVGKGILIAVLTRLTGQESGVALRTGLVLAQGGEFGFALLALALNHRLLDLEQSQAVLSAIVLSMALSPLVIRYNGAVAKRLFARSYLQNRQQQAEDLREVVSTMNRHVILCGFGHMGQNLARFLRVQGVPYVALELDPVLIQDARAAGEEVFYGNCTHREILSTVGIERARVLVITFEAPRVQERILHLVRSRRAELPVLVRTRDDRYFEALKQAGATEVIAETLEASTVLASHLLQYLEVPTTEILHLVEQARCNQYLALRGHFTGALRPTIEQPDAFRLHTVVLVPYSDAVGSRLGDLGLEQLGVVVRAVRRGAIRGEDPDPELRLHQGDALILQGTAEALAQAEWRLLRGVGEPRLEARA